MRSEQQYKSSQQRMLGSRTYRWFWEFWAVYAFLLFVLAFAYMLVTAGLYSQIWLEIVTLSAISFFLARIIIITMINFFYKRERPYQKFKFDPFTSKFFSFKTTRPNSFPSRHTIAYMAVATVVLMYFPWIGLGLIMTSLLAGVGRVVLGYHWPSDILVGAVLGSLVGYFTVIYMLPGLFT